MNFKALGFVSAAALALLATAVPASAEIVFLTSGRTLSVKGHKIDGESIVLTLRSGGQVTCDKTLVSKIEADEVPYPEPPVVAAERAGAGMLEVKSPMVGTYYGASEPGAKPYVAVGDRVQKGQTLCIIEAMKIMNEIESEFTGVVKETLAQDAQPVEYGQVLFRIDPNG